MGFPNVGNNVHSDIFIRFISSRGSHVGIEELIVYYFSGACKDQKILVYPSIDNK